MLTGREARLRAEGAGRGRLVRLRFGSSGVAVKALQSGLKRSGHYSGAIDGSMGGGTTLAFVKWQQAVDGGKADTIVTPASGRRLGFDLVKRMSVPITKAMNQYQLPGVDTGMLLESQRKNVEALTTANKQALEGIQAVSVWQVSQSVGKPADT